MATYRTSIWGQRVEIAGDFSKASLPVWDAGGGKQAAYFQYGLEAAMRAALEEFAMLCGESLENEEVIADIDMALVDIVEDDDTSHAKDE